MKNMFLNILLLISCVLVYPEDDCISKEREITTDQENQNSWTFSMISESTSIIFTKSETLLNLDISVGVNRSSIVLENIKIKSIADAISKFYVFFDQDQIFFLENIIKMREQYLLKEVVGSFYEITEQQIEDIHKNNYIYLRLVSHSNIAEDLATFTNCMLFENQNNFEMNKVLINDSNAESIIKGESGVYVFSILNGSNLDVSEISKLFSMKRIIENPNFSKVNPPELDEDRNL